MRRTPLILGLAAALCGTSLAVAATGNAASVASAGSARPGSAAPALTAAAT
ncbi:MAG: hypothetical protein HOV83_21605, partial [Catenulispora sp.]|nr:hypothetical protein [Catenulispora sp.]